MLRAAATFLIGALVLVICLYVFQLVLAMLTLPPDIAHFALVIVGLLGLVVLVWLTALVFRGAGPPL